MQVNFSSKVFRYQVLCFLRADVQALQQVLHVDDPVAFTFAKQFVDGAMLPFLRMLHRSGAYHVQVNIKQAASQVIPALNAGGMKPVAPE